MSEPAFKLRLKSLQVVGGEHTSATRVISSARSVGNILLWPVRRLFPKRRPIGASRVPHGNAVEYDLVVSGPPDAVVHLYGEAFPITGKARLDVSPPEVLKLSKTGHADTVFVCQPENNTEVGQSKVVFSVVDPRHPDVVVDNLPENRVAVIGGESVINTALVLAVLFGIVLQLFLTSWPVLGALILVSLILMAFIGTGKEKVRFEPLRLLPMRKRLLAAGGVLCGFLGWYLLMYFNLAGSGPSTPYCGEPGQVVCDWVDTLVDNLTSIAAASVLFGLIFIALSPAFRPRKIAGLAFAVCVAIPVMFYDFSLIPNKFISPPVVDLVEGSWNFPCEADQPDGPKRNLNFSFDPLVRSTLQPDCGIDEKEPLRIVGLEKVPGFKQGAWKFEHERKPDAAKGKEIDSKNLLAAVEAEQRARFSSSGSRISQAAISAGEIIRTVKSADAKKAIGASQILADVKLKRTQLARQRARREARRSRGLLNVKQAQRSALEQALRSTDERIARKKNQLLGDLGPFQVFGGISFELNDELKRFQKQRASVNKDLNATNNQIVSLRRDDQAKQNAVAVANKEREVARRVKSWLSHQERLAQRRIDQELQPMTIHFLLKESNRYNYVFQGTTKANVAIQTDSFLELAGRPELLPKSYEMVWHAVRHSPWVYGLNKLFVGSFAILGWSLALIPLLVVMVLKGARSWTVSVLAVLAGLLSIVAGLWLTLIMVVRLPGGRFSPFDAIFPSNDTVSIVLPGIALTLMAVLARILILPLPGRNWLRVAMFAVVALVVNAALMFLLLIMLDPNANEIGSHTDNYKYVVAAVLANVLLTVVWCFAEASLWDWRRNRNRSTDPEPSAAVVVGVESSESSALNPSAALKSESGAP